jgi:hypothetical protein
VKSLGKNCRNFEVVFSFIFLLDFFHGGGSIRLGFTNRMCDMFIFFTTFGFCLFANFDCSESTLALLYEFYSFARLLLHLYLNL